MQRLDSAGVNTTEENVRFGCQGSPMPHIAPPEAPSELRTANKAANGRHCRRCGKPLSGRQKDFCGFGSGSCHRLYYSEARKIGASKMVPEDKRRDLILFGRDTTVGDRLLALTRAAKHIFAL